MSRNKDDFKQIRQYDCILCGAHFNGYGNNPAPIIFEDEC